MFATVALATSVPYEHLYELLTNTPDMTWKPRIPRERWTLEQIKSKIGGVKKVAYDKPSVSAVGDAPSVFSWLEQRPDCTNITYDQENCGASWAFVTTGMFSDNRCIQGLDKQRVRYSE